ncbi:catalase family peroxidase [Pseudomonas sp. GV071]|uniref:catalase family peroxidase n=1 Tax=Pseudomonas sp. GV071 TaxID=2135754 RepID=UPI000D3B77D6|nr:catalase family peroxidase [Pseudomonas sp. GV071]PTQ70059.1 catalase [Pseudomonas sp. GV071]
MADSDPQQRPPLSPVNLALRLGAIGAVTVLIAAALAYTGGYFSPERVTPARVVDVLEHNNGEHPGFRRNHPKGICVTGYFDSNGAGVELSSAEVFSATRTPVQGRFSLPTGNPYSPDSAAPLRSMALRFQQANGQQWRTGMNSMAVFPVGTPEAFFGLLQATAPDPATGKPDPKKAGAFFAAHPETGAFLAWVKTAKPAASFTTETYNSVNAFYLTNAAGVRQTVRWSMVADAQADSAAPTADDYLQADLQQRLANGPQRWSLILTLANPGDPSNDASKAWSGEHRQVNAGTLVIEHEQAQDNGACRDINYDPLILPSGIEGSDDPLLAARSAAYAASYQRRAGEVESLPHHANAAQEQRP